MKKTIIGLLIGGFIIEIIYFNMVFDFALLFLLFMTALSIGSYFKIKTFGIDRVLVSLAVGLGVLGYFIWLSTFYNFNYKSLYLLASISLIYLRKEMLYQYASIILDFTKNIYKTNAALLILVMAAFVFYIIAAAAPITQFDALTKHIAIPFKMLHTTNWDYNVIETIVFGEYALLPYTFYLYLLALGGIKSLVLFNTVLSFLSLITILRIATFLSKEKIHFFLIAALYLTMPLIFSLSTILYVDFVPLYFIFTAYLILQYSSLYSVRFNLFAIALLSGFAMFSKQVAFFYITPMIFYILYLIFLYRKKLIAKDLVNLLKFIIVFLLPFIPVILIIWYKTGNPLFPFMNGLFQSHYFPLNDFVDPFQQSVLGINFYSLYSIVFDTSKNLEIMPLGAGVYILLAPFIFLGLLIKAKRKRFVFLILVTIGSYWLSTKFSYNIRYFLGSLILLIPTLVYTLLIISSKIKHTKYPILFTLSAISILQAGIIFYPGNYLGFKTSMLVPNDQLITLENSFILNAIPNKEKQFVLSNNDPFRGTFLGHFYILNWHNSYLLGVLNSDQLTPADFLRQFDYYLIDKRLPLSMYTRKLDPENADIKDLIERYSETESHILYKIKKDMVSFKKETFISPIIVKVDTPQTRVIENPGKSYKIIFDAQKVESGNAMGRFQINWIDKNGGFLGTSLIPFELKNERSAYQSDTIENIPKNAATGIFYLTSHDTVPIKIYGYEILYIPNNNLLRNELNNYDKKFPHLSKD